MNPREESIIEVDDDVRTVAAFMMANMPAARLVAVAKAIGEMAPLLWGHYTPEPIQALRLRRSPNSACDRHVQPNASGSHLEVGYVGGDSEAAAT